MQPASLLKLIVDHFNLEELKNLCHEVNIPYEELGSPGKTALARDVIEYAERHGLVEKLIIQCEVERPNVSWPEVSRDGQVIRTFPLHRIPYLKNPNFTGRTQLLAQLETNLKEARATAITQTITGLGGVGKTQLALEYCYQHQAAYDLIWWLQANDEPIVGSNLTELAQALGIATVPEIDELREQVLRWLTTTRKRWLLVFDNADQIDPRVLQPYLPRSGKGHVLITSRNPNWRGTTVVLPIEKFTPTEAVRFLLARSGKGFENGQEEKTADKLSEVLGYLPLALEHAAAYVETTGSSFEQYLGLFQQQRGRLWQKAAPPDAYHATITTTWEIAFQAIQQANPTAITLFDLCCFLDGAEIPLSLLQEHTNALPEELAATVSDSLAFDEAMAALRRYSLLSRTGDALTIHRLVQAVGRDRMGAERTRQWAEQGIKLLAEAWPYDQYNLATWEASQKLLPHLLAVVGEATTNQVETTDLAYLCGHAGFYLNARGAYPSARSHFAQALAIREKLLGADHLATATSLNNLGLLLYTQGELAAAKPYYERALAIWEKQLGADHPDTATSLNNLGTLLYAQGELAAAKPYYERALAITEKQLGADHPATAQSLNNLGMLLKDQGELAAAKPYLERALAIREKQLGADHPDTAQSLNNLGSLLQDQGELAAAKPYYERALAIYEKQLGADHPHTALSLNNLGTLLYAQGELAAAKPYYERALAITEKQLGADHPDTAGSLNNLGSLLQDQGDLAAAKPYYERALAIYEKQLGADHPATATSLGNLGSLLQDQGDLAAAKPYYERALAIMEKQLGADHPLTAQSLNNLGMLLKTQGELAAAKPYYERALAIYEKQLGADHPHTRIVRNNLAWLNREMGE